MDECCKLVEVIIHCLIIKAPDWAFIKSINYSLKREKSRKKRQDQKYLVTKNLTRSFAGGVDIRNYHSRFLGDIVQPQYTSYLSVRKRRRPWLQYSFDTF